MIEVINLGKSYQVRRGRRLEQIEALQDVQFTIEPGSFVSLIGPSGCGKSTLLSIMGGLLQASSGEIRIDGQPVLGPMPNKVAYVFQNYALLPWRTVLQNVMYGLELQRVPLAKRKEKALEAIELVGLSDFLDRYPRELSGGMQQRVAIARALTLGCELLLLDEPFGALDEQTRMQMGEELLRIWASTRKTIVMVTHSLSEAVYLSDRLIVFSSRPGRVKRIIDSRLGRPRSLDIMTTQEFAIERNELWHELSEEWAKEKGMAQNA